MRPLVVLMLVGCAASGPLCVPTIPPIPLRPAETWLCSTEAGIKARVVSDAEPLVVELNGQRATCYMAAFP